MKNILEKTILSTILGLTLMGATGCNTVYRALNYEGESGPALQQKDNLNNYKSINGSSYTLFPEKDFPK